MNIDVNLSLFELDKILSLIEEKEILRKEDEIICSKIYMKLEEALSSINLNTDDDVGKIFKKQKSDYIK